MKRIKLGMFILGIAGVTTATILTLYYMESSWLLLVGASLALMAIASVERR